MDGEKREWKRRGGREEKGAVGGGGGGAGGAPAPARAVGGGRRPRGARRETRGEGRRRGAADGGIRAPAGIGEQGRDPPDPFPDLEGARLHLFAGVGTGQQRKVRVVARVGADLGAAR